MNITRAAKAAFRVGRQTTVTGRRAGVTALSAAMLLGPLTGIAAAAPAGYPVQAAYTPAGPYAVMTGVVTNPSGQVTGPTPRPPWSRSC